MRIGRLDREIVIQSPVITRDAIGGTSTSWTTFASVWGQTIPESTGERFKADEVRASSTLIFRIRYLPGVLTTMRLSFESKYYRILGVVELGRRETLDITAEYFQQDGSGS